MHLLFKQKKETVVAKCPPNMSDMPSVLPVLSLPQPAAASLSTLHNKAP